MDLECRREVELVPAKNWSRLRWCVLHRDFVDDEDWKTIETLELMEIAEVIQTGKTG